MTQPTSSSRNKKQYKRLRRSNSIHPLGPIPSQAVREGTNAITPTDNEMHARRRLTNRRHACLPWITRSGSLFARRQIVSTESISSVAIRRPWRWAESVSRPTRSKSYFCRFRLIRPLLPNLWRPSRHSRPRVSTNRTHLVFRLIRPRSFSIPRYVARSDIAIPSKLSARLLTRTRIIIIQVSSLPFIQEWTKIFIREERIPPPIIRQLPFRRVSNCLWISLIHVDKRKTRTSSHFRSIRG